jgi:uncharacterized protein YbdZ (MbtH family)
MSGFGRPWALAGGWAVDAWVGHQTREHGDVDIVVSHEDQHTLFEHLSGWNMVAHDPPIAGGGSNTDRWDGRSLTLPAHIHARPSDAEIPDGWPVAGAPLDGRNLEVILDRREGDDWWLHDDPRVNIAADQYIRVSPVGLPTLSPEVVLFFKATAYPADARFPRALDERDFLALCGRLRAQERQWLRGALTAYRPGHGWLGHIAG